MKISTAHKRFADRLGKPEALEKPQDFLGPNTTTIINFWLYLDTLSQEQWKTVAERYLAERYSAAWDAAVNAAWDAAAYAAGSAAGSAAWDAAAYAAAYATYELIGSHILIEQGKSLFFVPMFNDL